MGCRLFQVFVEAARIYIYIRLFSFRVLQTFAAVVVVVCRENHAVYTAISDILNISAFNILSDVEVRDFQLDLRQRSGINEYSWSEKPARLHFILPL